MVHQVRNLVLRVATNIKWYQLAALGLALSVIIQGAPITGGGGS